MKNKTSLWAIIFISSMTLLFRGVAQFVAFAIDIPTDDGSVVVPPVIEEKVKISYSPKNVTNGSVMAEFVLLDENIIVTNNEGKTTYEFLENSEFVFEYKNILTGEVGTLVAKVDWIDKVAPTGVIVYDYSSYVNHSVKATLVPSEDVVVTNNVYEEIDDYGNVIVGDPMEHVFNENGEFTFEFEDLAGNKGKAIAKVDWIDNVTPVASIKYDVTSVTSGPVVATVLFDEENVIIINNEHKNYYSFNENGEFIFEFVDQAGNAGTIKASVNWIDKSVSDDMVHNNVSKPADDVNVSVTKKKPNKTKVSSTTKKDEKESEENEIIFKNIKADNIELKIDEKIISDGVNLKKNSLRLSNELSSKFNVEHEYFEVYLENEKGKRLEFKSNDKNVLIVSLDENKVFSSIYFITETDNVQNVEFDLVNGNKLEIKNPKLGKYLIEYKNFQKDMVLSNETNYEDEEASLNACIVICSCVIAAVFLTAIICVFIKEY